MFVALLREFACRTAQEHRENLQSAHSQLRVINSIAREILGATRKSEDGFGGDFPMPDDPVKPPMIEQTEA
jgi:hypothetical protein